MGYYTSSAVYNLPTLGGSAIYQGLAFNADGTIMFVHEKNVNYKIYSFGLSVPWSIASASPLSEGTSVYSRINFCFDPAGTRLYYSTNDVYVYQYSLATPWAVAGETYVRNASLVNGNVGIAISPDGTKMYYANANAIRQYALSTAWNPQTGSYQGQIVSAVVDMPGEGLWFSPDGLQLWAGGNSPGGPKVVLYELVTPWNILTSTPILDSLITSQDDISGLCFNSDMSKIYLLDATHAVYEYNFSTLPPEFWTNFIGQREIIV